MADEEDSEELVMIAEKARSLLTRSERQMLSQYCTSYLSGQTSVRHFVDALLRLLPTPDKASFLVELRELVREEDHDEYDHRVFSVRRPFRVFQFQSNNSLDYEQSTECLLQVDRHPLYSDYELLPESSPPWSPVVSRVTPNKLLKPRAVGPNHVGGTKAGIHQANPFQGGLHQTNMPMMELDMKTAFPALVASAFKATASLIGKDSFSAEHVGTSTQAHPTKQPQQQRSAKTTSTSRRPVLSSDESSEVVIRKSTTILGMAIEGGSDTRHPLPRIISMDGKGTAFEAAGLRIGQTILQVNGITTAGLTHEEAARLIANTYADRSVPEMKLLVSASTFRPNANYQPEN